MSSIGIIGETRGDSARAHSLVLDGNPETPRRAARLDEFSGPLRLRSGLLVAGFVLLLSSLGMLLLDIAVRP